MINVDFVFVVRTILKRLYFIYLIKIMSDDENLTDDEEYMELALIIGFPRRRKMFLERLNHFIKWRDDQFFKLKLK